MHLQKQARAQTSRDQLVLHLTHSQLDDVSSSALHGMVHRRSLAEATLGGVFRVQLGNVAATPEERGCVTVFMCLLNHTV